VIFSIYAAIYLNSLAGNSTVHYMSFYNINTFSESDNSRKSFALQFIIIPCLIGSFIATLLYLPVPMILSLIYPVLSGMIFITPYKLSIYIKNIPTSSEINFEKFSLTSVFICIFVVGVFRFVLVPGIIL
jgi:hypothetical protein